MMSLSKKIIFFMTFSYGWHRLAHSYAAIGPECWGEFRWYMIPIDPLFLCLILSVFLLLPTLSRPNICVINFTFGGSIPSVPPCYCLCATCWRGHYSSTSNLLGMDSLALTSPIILSKRQSGCETWPGSLSGCWTLLFNNMLLTQFSCFGFDCNDCHIVVLYIMTSVTCIPV